ncbi:hypothetical protein KKJ01_18840 [Xenorhabdus bovienii]|uniref:Uncharacterized protein n=1 Tax=Xenorhabdus bovienii TaxID=40576 RepID=A0AAJ1JCR0_XENBV|nr:hypothetical protein [Xenorhabdus bovienii]MDE1480217.1 hypothetical protein [Xenorhabdus bovienii]MDE1491131.1 hypothetical protein [Xenorhabdus bovienii]MDE9511908.1 hypothetical protein [Xenorhabdus bovienii]MDE9523550.1 hypothetical protein [Xenorhabdus bovienii]
MVIISSSGLSALSWQCRVNGGKLAKVVLPVIWFYRIKQCPGIMPFFIE